LAAVLITQAQLQRRVRALADEIERAFPRRELTVVAILNGTVMFLADLMRHWQWPMRLDFVGVSSYRSGTEPGELFFTKQLKLEVSGRDVLLVDDILDSGKTLQRVMTNVAALRPRRLKTCVLLDKPARRTEDIAADFVGFTIPDWFVVGYGLDFAERYRNLPFIGVLKAALYRPKAPAGRKR
jgi:hypoxanthine phosphoribosyltransferase